MKKIALTSLVAVFAASGAMAAHVSNPLYIPAAGEFYSITDVNMSTNHDVNIIASYESAKVGLYNGEDYTGIGTNGVTATETFGFGLTDWLSASVHAGASTQDWFKFNSMDSLGLGLTARVVNHEGWVADLLGGYEVNNVRPTNAVAFDKDVTEYTWTAGVRGGYTTGAWTIAAHATWEYGAPESFKWNKSHIDGDRITDHFMHFGLDGQVYLTQNWNLVAGAEYTTSWEYWSENIGYWKATAGVNYDFNPCSFVGVYATKYIVHDGLMNDGEEEFESAGNWTTLDGFQFGAKFGVKF